MKKNYDSKDLVVLEGLDAVRLRPGMYIGTTGSKGMHHLLWEIVDNSMDELANGFGSKMQVVLHADNSASVIDNGRGIPTDIHPKLKVSGVEVVFTQLHAGGKFESENYKFSGGLHGVGASVVNALSEWCEVTVDRNGKRYQMSFHSPEENGKIRSGILKEPLHVIGDSKSTGSRVTFLPDKRVFKDIKFDYDVIAARLRELAFLNKGIEITLVDERVEIGKKPQVKQFKYVGGISDYVSFVTNSKTKLYDTPIYIEGKSDRMEVQAAFIHCGDYQENIFSYVNNIPTIEGGTHETGFKSAITRVLNEAARKLNYLKDKDSNFLGEDFREGITVALSVKMRNVQFEGQTKTKLGNPEAKSEVEQIVYGELEKIIIKNEYKKSLDAIIDKAKTAKKAREAVKKAKDVARQKNSLENSSLVGKIASCSGKKAELNELFIVEGDSAGGSAKQGRDRYFQAILPLRGKPLNVEKKRMEQILQNEEIRTIISAIGAGVGEDFTVKNIKYHKVVILADADQDGGHIKSILLTFFYRYMKDLITNGHLYIGMPPLYKVYKNDKVLYAYTDEDLEEAKKKLGKNYGIQRYKGLGEMNPEQLWETTLDPKNRLLVKVEIEDALDAENMITTWMGDDVEARKNYISTYADFNKVDSFNPTENTKNNKGEQ